MKKRPEFSVLGWRNLDDSQWVDAPDDARPKLIERKPAWDDEIPF
jgi:hypothetical protein